MQTAPWWGIPVIAGAFALVGVLIAQLVVLRIDRRKTRRDDQRRWDVHRQEVYVAFLRDYETLRHDDVVDGVKLAAFLLRFQELTLLASKPVTTAAMDMFSRVDNLCETGKCDDKPWAQASTDFVAAARVELGVVLSSRKIVVDLENPFIATFQAFGIVLTEFGSVLKDMAQTFWPFKLKRRE